MLGGRRRAGLSDLDCGLCWQDGARLSVSICTRKATVAEVAAEVAALNPHLTVGRLMANVEVDPADPSRVDTR